MKPLWLTIALLLAACATAFPQSADEQYIRIYQSIQEADRLNDAGQKQAAAGKYLEAQNALRRFQSVYPGWNERVIAYRLNYVATRLAPYTAATVPPATSGETPPPGVTPTNATPATAQPAVISAELQQQLASLQAELEKLEAENKRLGAKLKEALSVQPAAVDPRELAKAEEHIRSLQKENELLKVYNRPSPAVPAGESNAETARRLAEQNDTIAALRAENDILKARTADLQQRLATASQPSTAPPPRTADDRDALIQKLQNDLRAAERDRATLKQALAERERERAPVTAPSADQIERLRARLQVLEATPIPYTTEELALLNRSGTTIALNAKPPAGGTTPPPAEGSPTPRKVSRQIPPGAGPLVRDAERAFAQRNFAEAERKYLDVLRQDEENVSTLANLASTQLELGRIADAEKHALKALSLDPEDHFSLYVLGRVRFSQDKMDEALDALSRSAAANPEYAETQNYLGIILSEKGLRVPAEAALRKAIQLQPNHAAAHNNLAVVYATQKPPALALAKWHYQKALGAGHPRNVDLEKLLDAP